MKYIGRLISWIMIIVLTLSLLLFVAPRIFGVEMFVVLSSSMKPTYSVGDLLYVVPTEFEDVKVGDVITFTKDSTMMTVTHRVISIDYENKSFQTKGDANNVNDGTPVFAIDNIGVVKVSIPYIGNILEMLSTSIGRLILISVGVISMLIAAATTLYRNKK